MTTRSTPRVLGAALATAVLIAILSIKLNSFRDYQIAEIAIEVTAVAGLTILTGLSGQISLGNGAFMAIGAYTTALLMLHLNWPFYLVLVIAAVITAAAGAVVGVAAARLHGPYLAGATLLLGVALPVGRVRLRRVLRRRPGPGRQLHHARLPRRELPADPVGGVGLLGGGPDHPGAAGQPGAQPGRPQLARGPRRRGGGRAGRA